jgi:glycosyltransferase involved in cell wall biosynthesis
VEAAEETPPGRRPPERQLLRRADHPRDYTFKYLDEYRPARPPTCRTPDVVVATWWETAEWVKAFPASKGAKAYFIQHYEAFAGGEARVDATWRLPMHKICVAQWLVDIARQRFNDQSAELVANAVDLEQFTAPPRGKQPVPTVGVMYSPIPFKGCDVSIKAYELARQQVPELKLITFGAIDPQASLPLPAGTEYRYQPPQDELRDYYGRCDAWLFGSRSEGFGLPLLEAMACRTPVIATPAGAAPELVHAAGGGLLVPMEDPQAMAEAILKVVRMDGAEWKDMSDRALQTAEAHNWDTATDQFEAALKRAADRPQLRNAG